MRRSAFRSSLQIMVIAALVGLHFGCGDESNPSGIDEAEVGTLLRSLITGAGPNEPAGFTRFAEHDFSGLPPSAPPGKCEGPGIIDGCWFRWDPDSGFSTVSVADAPASAPGVLQIAYPTGLTGGASPGLFQGWDTESEVNSTQFKAIYESSWVRVPTPDFEMDAIGVKFLGYFGVAEAGRDTPPS